jgi:hypothetical protein
MGKKKRKAGEAWLGSITRQPKRTAVAPMRLDDTCHYCHHPLIEIDHYSERLIGCIECNRWGRPGDTTLPMQLHEDHLEALRASRAPSSSRRCEGGKALRPRPYWVMAEIQLQSTLTCPHCGYQATETMPTDAYVAFYDCKGCGTTLKHRRFV